MSKVGAATVDWEWEKENSWKRYYSAFMTGFQILLDASTVLFSYMAALFFYTGYLGRISPQTAVEFLWISVGAAVLYVFLLDRFGQYRKESSLLNIKEISGILKVSLYAAAILLSLSFYVRFVSFSRLTVSIALALTPVLLIVQRQIFYRFQVYFHQRGLARRRVLIFGSGTIGQQIARRLLASPGLGMYPVGFLDDDPDKKNEWISWKNHGPSRGIRIFGDDSYISRAKRLGVEMVIIAIPSATFERNKEVMEACAENGLEYAIVPNSYGKFVQDLDFMRLGSVPILRQANYRVNFVYLAMKRVVDLVLSFAAMVLLAPFGLVLAALIKADSKGPIIFKQKRVGQNGREFSFYKFRTMRIDAPKYAKAPLTTSDDRITKLGRWLRRTSMDELPQLFNVFRGDMSLVGPRPEMPFIVDEYTPLERIRLSAKPGITGIWQISAVRGEDIHKNIEYDLFYIRNRSALLDLAILIRTFFSVVRGIGAF